MWKGCVCVFKCKERGVVSGDLVLPLAVSRSTAPNTEMYD